MKQAGSNAQALGQKGHPRGLAVLFATEMWERFNYYGMRAVLILFMTQALLFDKKFASNLYGSYIGLIYLTPLIGGYVADRFWGNKRSILIGGIVMAIGEFILFFCGQFYDQPGSMSTVLFFSGLGFMIAGNGFFKPNISSMVGQLYPKGDRRIDAAYTIFYMGINMGGALGPIVCGYFGDTGNPADFKWAFLAGGIAMLIGVVVQKIYQDKYLRDPEGRQLGNTPVTPLEETGPGAAALNVPLKKSMWLNPVAVVIGLLLFSGIAITALYVDANKFSFLSWLLIASVVYIAIFLFSDKSLDRIAKEKMVVMFVVSFFVIFFWAAFEQAGASLTFFARDQTQRDMGFFTIPASFFQSVNSIFVIIFAPLFALLWIKLGRKEPSAPTKMAIGLFLLALGFLWIAMGAKAAGPGVKVSIIWLTGMYALHTWGELCLSPIGLSLFNKLAPLKFASLLMAVWFLANSFGNKFAGVLSGFYPEPGRPTSFLGYQMTNLYEFFMLFVAMAGAASIILFLLTKRLQKMMHGIK